MFACDDSQFPTDDVDVACLHEHHLYLAPQVEYRPESDPTRMLMEYPSAGPDMQPLPNKRTEVRKLCVSQHGMSARDFHAQYAQARANQGKKVSERFIRETRHGSSAKQMNTKMHIGRTALFRYDSSVQV